MDVKPVSVGEIKEGKYVVIDGIACVVKSVQKSKPGKHGHAKCRIEAVGLINEEKKIVVKPAHDTMDSPLIEKENAQVLSIKENVANVMDLKSFETFDLKVPEELKDEIKEGSQVTYWIILKDKIMKQVRTE